MQKTIGISLGNNTSVAVFGEYGVELAISEERLTGEKNTKKFPINALKRCLESSSIRKVNPIIIGISSYEVINNRTFKYIPENEESFVLRSNYADFYSFLEAYIRDECNVPDNILIIISRVNHHTAHMLPAVYMSGFKLYPEKLIAVTYDGFGDGVCATITDCDTNELLSVVHTQHSLGLVYQYVTGALGYKEHEHEGKITGLAAFGKPDYVSSFENMIIGYDSETTSFIRNYGNISPVNVALSNYNKNINDFDSILQLKNSVYALVNMLLADGVSPADIASSVQAYVEQLITTWILDVLACNNSLSKYNIVLSGGLFANVKVNYAIKQRVKPENLYILPCMGDEGTSIGAAISAWNSYHGKSNYPVGFINELYIGTLSTRKWLQSNDIDLDKYNVYWTRLDAMQLTTNRIVNLLKNKKIVAISSGHSEFGPRALGNHSILCDASDAAINDTLNKKLGRTEFMPFAPITLDIYCEDLFTDYEGLENSLKFMTVAVPVTDEFKIGYSAACHVDDTARPQVLHKLNNAWLYEIIYNYSILTGNKALINTSFNLHGSPIIFDETTAYNSFVKSDLDALWVGDKLIVKKDVQS